MWKSGIVVHMLEYAVMKLPLVSKINIGSLHLAGSTKCSKVFVTDTGKLDLASTPPTKNYSHYMSIAFMNNYLNSPYKYHVLPA